MDCYHSVFHCCVSIYYEHYLKSASYNDGVSTISGDAFFAISQIDEKSETKIVSIS